MDGITFTWNQQKYDSNLQKHGVSFEEACTVFLDEFARLIPDPNILHDEERYLLLGLSQKQRLLVTCHCEVNDNQIRIISARKASRQERNVYERYRYG